MPTRAKSRGPQVPIVFPARRKPRPGCIGLLCMATVAPTATLAASPTVEAKLIASGGQQTCAVTTAGALKCWGGNEAGQLGDGTNLPRTTPIDVTGLGSGVAVVVAGSGHTCALTTAGALKCWGGNAEGRIGDGTTTTRTTPVHVTGLGSGVVAVDAGGHTCAATTMGALKCWGMNSLGQLGDGTTTSRTTPVDVTDMDSEIASVAVGDGHTCALATTGALKCWGYNAEGRIGDGTTTNRTTPVEVTGLGSGVLAVDVGGAHTCAVTTAGAVKCWGSNLYGQLGDGTTTSHTAPVDVTGMTPGVTMLAAGSWHTCAVTTASALKCWGYNGYGQLGDGTTISRTTPIDVAGLGSGVAAVAASYNHTCALTMAGALKCWGHNEYGQLGDGSRANRATPLYVTGFAPAAVCGDGYLAEGETCDDGNRVGGDCCSSTCTFEVNGTACDDADACMAVTTCTAGICGGRRTECNSPCEVCSTELGDCVVGPRLNCKQVATVCESRLKLFNNVADVRDKLDWEWRAGERTEGVEFDDPADAAGGSDYALCMFDDVAGSPSVLLAAKVAAGIGWKRLGAGGYRGFLWKGPGDATSGGLTMLQLRPGVAGKASLRVQGKGETLAMPTLPLGGTTTLQLQASGGACWQATFADSTCTTTRNDAGMFYGTGD